MEQESPTAWPQVAYRPRHYIWGLPMEFTLLRGTPYGKPLPPTWDLGVTLPPPKSPFIPEITLMRITN